MSSPLSTQRGLTVDQERAPLLHRRHSQKSRRSSFASTVEEYAEAVLDRALLFQADINASGFVVPDAPEDPFSDDEEDARSTDEEEDDEEVLRPTLHLIMFGLYTGGFLAAIDSTIVVASLVRIGAEFECFNTISFLGTSFMMTQTAAQPLYGTCSDIFGRRGATLFASVVFFIGTLGCGLAQTYPQLLAARAIAGVGGAGLGVMMSIVGSDLIPLRKRGIFQSYANIIWNLGSALGGPVGGFCSDKLGWRWGFLIQIPLCAIHFGLTYFLVENSFDPNYDANSTDTWKKFKQVDFLGSLTMILGIGFGLLGLSMGGNQYAWDSPVVVGCLVASLVFLVVFGLLETFVVPKPLLAPELLFARTPGFITLTTFFSVMSQLAVIYTIPVWFSTIKGLTNTDAGLYLIPIVLSTSTASLATGITMNKTGKYKKMLIFASIFNILGPFLMIFWDRKTTAAPLFWATMPFVGLGYGSMITIATVALISSVPPERMAQAISSSFLFRSLGAVVGVALSTAVQQNTLQKGLGRVIIGPGAKELIAELRKDLSYVWTLDPAMRESILNIFADAGRNIFMASSFICFLAFLCAASIKEYKLPSRLDRRK